MTKQQRDVLWGAGVGMLWFLGLSILLLAHAPKPSPMFCKWIAFNAVADTVSLAQVCAPAERWSRAFEDSQRARLRAAAPVGVKYAQ